ncbi:MAG: PTS lactose/cellobiose transporter subunit IIA [Bombilactobacillus mellifer]|nr:PTS lactose/cellobiose transporter subunit IIA [Bombilactobacillus mellifer]
MLLGEMILVKAHENLTIAHNLQTKLLQDEVKGQGQSC